MHLDWLPCTALISVFLLFFVFCFKIISFKGMYLDHWELVAQSKALSTIKSHVIFSSHPYPFHPTFKEGVKDVILNKYLFPELKFI